MSHLWPAVIRYSAIRYWGVSSNDVFSGVAEDEHVGEPLPGFLNGAGQCDAALRVRAGGAEGGLVEVAGDGVGGGLVRDRRLAALVLDHETRCLPIFFGPVRP